jgi:hypothetical protein
MKKYSKILLSILTTIFVLSCSKSDSPATENPTASCASTIPFLQTGKVFNYNIIQFGAAAGTIKFSIGACNGTGFLVNRETKDVSGNVVASGSATDLWKQDGDFILTDSNNNGDYFAKIYKKNAALNDTWQYTKTDGAVVTHKVIDVDSLITVPAGQFHCKVFKYTNSGTINDSYIFWDDQVGQIQENAGFFKTVLKSLN